MSEPPEYNDKDYLSVIAENQPCGLLPEKLQNHDIEDCVRKSNPIRKKKVFVINEPEKIATCVRDMVARTDIHTQEQMRTFLDSCRKYKIIPSAVSMLHIYRLLCYNGEFVYNSKYEYLLQTKRHRGQSGVMVIAVFTAPFPSFTKKNGEKVKQEFSCEYDCFFCPAEPNQPRSYLLKEPGVLRANDNGFDVVEQFYDRAQAYVNMGHHVDKIELLVLGGTWSSYPEEYQDEFIRDIYFAANTFYDPNRGTSEIRSRLTLEREQKINETAQSRIIGLTLETRPDKITPREIKRFRRFGVTRVQMGVQHLDDRVLYRINRRCKTKHAIDAIKLLKDQGIKVDIHIMPDLPTPLKEGVSNRKETFDPEDIDETINMYELDLEMFKRIVSDPDLQVDQWKIYPCEVVPWTRIEQDYKTGSYKPYGDQAKKTDWTLLCDLLMEISPLIPKWIRVNRLIRDIPNEYIMGGNQDINLRTLIEKKLIENGTPCNCIRCREIKGQKIDPSVAIMNVETFESSGGTEYFITFDAPEKNENGVYPLFGFLRLRFSPNSGKDRYGNIVFPELIDTAMIREVHVYGQVVKGNDSNVLADGNNAPQHAGFGTRMVNKAIAIAKENGYKRISVISGVGVKNFYRRFGFEDEDYYMTLQLDKITESIEASGITGPVITRDQYTIKICVVIITGCLILTYFIARFM